MESSGAASRTTTSVDSIDDVVYQRSFSSEDLWQVLNEESQHTHDAGLVRVVIDQKRVAKEQEQRRTLAANDTRLQRIVKINNSLSKKRSA